ncbi:MAG: hypothetical protein ACI4E5_12790 [Suilimivivens sp.]
MSTIIRCPPGELSTIPNSSTYSFHS